QPGIHPDLETICLKCLEKDPQRRYKSAAELAQRLRLYQEGRPIPDRPPPFWEAAWKWVKRHRAAALVSTLAGVRSVGVVGAAVALWYSQQLRHALDQTSDAKAEAQWLLYVARMNLAQGAWKDGNIRRLRDLLDRADPGDNRCFEWLFLWRLAHQGDRHT